MINKEKIINRLTSDYTYLVNKGYEVVGVFLQGSQNYGLSYEDSDIDTKAIILPSFEDIVLNKKPVSTTIILETEEHIDVKDIRLMFDNFKKQNINFLEILFTEYKFINPKYQKAISPLFENAEKIAHYNNYKAVNSIAGMIMEKHKALEHPYPTIKDRIDKYGFDRKQLHHIIRCNYFLTNYINGLSYEKCLTAIPKEWLIKIKRDPLCYDLATARALARFYDDTAKYIKDKYLETHELVIDDSVDEILNNIVCECMKINFGIKSKKF